MATGVKITGGNEILTQVREKLRVFAGLAEGQNLSMDDPGLIGIYSAVLTTSTTL